MKNIVNIIKFIIFIAYTISIFMVKNLNILILMFVINCVITILLKINLKSLLHSFIIFAPFIIFTAIINIFFSGLYEALIMGIKITICYHITYIYSKIVTVLEISNVIQTLCYPLKIFKIDTNNIGIMISISICMIPVLKNEMQALINAMKSKGKKLKINTIIIVIKPILISILQKTREMEKTLISKAYN